MTPEEQSTQRTRLEALKTSIETDLEDEDGMTDTVQLDGVMGRISRMDAMQAQQMALALQRRQKEQLLRVKSALERLDKQTYGRCLRCKTPISESRLDMIPEAVLCVRCAATPR
jgi:DnaK suppressor protein